MQILVSPSYGMACILHEMLTRLHVCSIKWLAQLSMFWVKLVDPFVGEKVGMLVEVELADGSTAAGIFVHKLLSQSVGWGPWLSRGLLYSQRHEQTYSAAAVYRVGLVNSTDANKSSPACHSADQATLH